MTNPRVPATEADREVICATLAEHFRLAPASHQVVVAADAILALASAPAESGDDDLTAVYLAGRYDGRKEPARDESGLREALEQNVPIGTIDARARDAIISNVMAHVARTALATNGNVS